MGVIVDVIYLPLASLLKIIVIHQLFLYVNISIQNVIDIVIFVCI